MSNHFYVVVLLGVLLLLPACAAAPEDGPYTPDWESLDRVNEAPDWFRDAKLGIYFHWGVYSVPAFGNEWYPRHMHREGHKVFQHHREKYGDPSKFGYHDFIPMFKAEKFDAGEWARLFRESGAQFAGPVAEHHDGFAMWDSELTPWCAGKMGPKRDLTGELEKAIRKEGLRFMTSFHHARNHQYEKKDNKGRTVWTGHYTRKEGWPTLDPKYSKLYGNMPREEFVRLWEDKLAEVIRKYSPDLIWFDSWLHEIPEEARRSFLATYFNHAVKRGKDVVVTFKQEDLPQTVAVVDYEKGRADRLTDFTWLTDDTISYGSWCYTEGLRIKPLKEVLHVFVDIVSKNGQLLLNISPRADGSIPRVQQDVLRGLGGWLKKFGEAIYGTRPFVEYGEGPTKMEKGGHFVRSGYTHTAEDIRYTRKGGTVYAIQMGWPGAGKKTVMKLFSSDRRAGDFRVTGVSLLGCDDEIEWSMGEKGLTVVAPSAAPDEMAVVWKLETEGTMLLREPPVVLEPVTAVLDGTEIKAETKGPRPSIGFWSNPKDSVHWLVKIKKAGTYRVSGRFACPEASRVALTVEGISEEVEAAVPATGDWNDFRNVSLGKISIPGPGVYHVTLKPADFHSWKPVNLVSLDFLYHPEGN